MEEGFENNRYKYARQCPCGKSNKDRKFSPFKGQAPDGMAKFGKCHSCGETFLPPLENDDGYQKTTTRKYIDKEVLKKSLSGKLEKDNFFKYVASMIGEDEARKQLLAHHVGTSKEGTVFWMVDGYGRVCQPKVVAYKEDGHRDRAKMPMAPKGYRGGDGYYPCSFNEVNAIVNNEDVVGFVESEKTAVLCNIFYPEITWVSGGGATGMTYDKSHPYKGRACLIFYDADEAGRDNSGKLMRLLQKDKCTVKVCDPFEDRTDGFDLADYVDAFHKDEDKLNWVRDYIKKKIKELSGEDKNDYESGIFRVRNQKDYLLDTFRHGKKRGETTHMMELDTNMKWKKTFIYTFTGYPNSGKSEVLLFQAILKAMYDNWTWLMYVPESMSSHKGEMTIDEVVDTLIHIYVGQSTDPDNNNQMSEEEYLNAVDFIDKHFIFLYPPDGHTKPSELLDYAQHVINNYEIKIQGIIIDPWNNMMSDQKPNELMDDYIMRELIGIKHFLIINDMVGCIVVHPKSPPINKTGEVPPANAFMLRGGAAFNNKSDCIVSVHRPDWFKEEVVIDMGGEEKTINGKNSTLVEIHVLKMKNQKLVGIILGYSRWHFNRKSNRYENESRLSPLDPAYRKLAKRSGTNLPKSGKIDKPDEVDQDQSSLDFNGGNNIDKDLPF